MKRFIQILAGFAAGDAISREALALEGLAKRCSMDAAIVVEDGRISPDLAGAATPLSRFRPSVDDLVVYHYGIDTPATGVFVTAPGRKVLMYHNITPSSFFRGYDDSMVERLDRGRSRLRDVIHTADAVWTVSAFNAKELCDLGRQDAAVFPLLFNEADYAMQPDPRILGNYTSPMKNVLFVGRVAPNKSIEDLIGAIAWYKKTINDRTRLTIVGSFHGTPRYHAMLQMYIQELDLPHVTFEGYASDAGLVAYYKTADVFVCPSRHEGYCLPLIEAMYHNVPVIARNCGGMPEAMGNAGVLFDDDDENGLAGLIHLVLEDAPTRQRILESQARRMTEVKARNPLAEFEALIQPLLS